ncbi:Receptor-type tyrosine-protein phosphatase beta, partial [Dissostichus eleginoides]
DISDWNIKYAITVSRARLKTRAMEDNSCSEWVSPSFLPATNVGYLSLYQSILTTSTPLPFKHQVLRHAAIHRLITMKERKRMGE